MVRDPHPVDIGSIVKCIALFIFVMAYVARSTASLWNDAPLHIPPSEGGTILCYV